jgi:hypothetical protein
MGKLYVEYLEGNNIYACSTCNVHLSSYSELISKVEFLNEFHSGYSYFFSRPSEEEEAKLIYSITCEKNDLFMEPLRTPILIKLSKR